MDRQDQPHLEVASIGLPVWQPALFSVAWLAGLELLIWSPDRGRVLWIAITVLAAVMIVTLTQKILNTRRRHRPPHGPLGALIIFIASAAATVFAGTLTTVTSELWRNLPAHAVALAGASLLFGWLMHQSREVLHPLRGRFAVFAMTICLWELGYAASSWAVFLSLPVWWTVGGMTGLTALAAMVVWWDAKISTPVIVRGLPLVALAGGELWLAAWWLPTAVFVGTTVATTALILYVQVARHSWLNTWHAGRGRRYVLTAASVIGVALLTARWL